MPKRISGESTALLRPIIGKCISHPHSERGNSETNQAIGSARRIQFSADESTATTSSSTIFRTTEEVSTDIGALSVIARKYDTSAPYQFDELAATTEVVDSQLQIGRITYPAKVWLSIDLDIPWNSRTLVGRYIDDRWRVEAFSQGPRRPVRIVERIEVINEPNAADVCALAVIDESTSDRQNKVNVSRYNANFPRDFAYDTRIYYSTASLLCDIPSWTPDAILILEGRMDIPFLAAQAAQKVIPTIVVDPKAREDKLNGIYPIASDDSVSIYAALRTIMPTVARRKVHCI